MGRQYNFYISPKQDLEFIKYLFEEGYKFVVPHAFWEDDIIKYDHDFDSIEIYDNMDSFMRIQEQHLTNVNLYRESWGKLLKTEYGFLDRSKSPLIEYCRCFIHPQEKFLSRGRIYISTYYKDEMENFDVIYKEYQKLVRVMKKKIEYKKYVFDNDQSFYWPSSQEAVDIVKSGHQFR